MKRRTHDAIGRIEVLVTGGQIVSRGTGFLVSRRHVLTAFHTVYERTATPVPLGSTIRISFRAGAQTTRWKLTEHHNLTDDWALLEIVEDTPISDIDPIPLGELDEHHRRFETHGFPLVKPDGKGYKGEILHPIKQYEAADAHELYVPSATGTPVKGLSGAPIIVKHRREEFAVGVLRSFLGKDTEIGKEVIGGALYACPSNSFLPKINQVIPAVRKRLATGTDPAIAETARHREPEGTRVPRLDSLDMLMTECFHLQQRLHKRETIAKRRHVCLGAAALALLFASLLAVSSHSAVSVVVAAQLLFLMLSCYYALVIYPLTTVRQCIRDSTLVLLDYQAGGLPVLSSTARQIKCSEVLHILGRVFTNRTPGGAL